jgi:hypothetical protein
MHRLYSTLGTAAFASALVLTAPTSATEVFDEPDNCVQPNCRSASLTAGVGADADAAITPFEIGIFAWAGHCLRLDVTRQDTDLVLNATAPGGLNFFNDDKGDGGCPNCPRVTIADTPSTGWYTVHISQFDTVQPIGANFQLVYGLYPAGNPNCPASALAAVEQDTADKPYDTSGGRPFGPGAPPR